MVNDTELEAELQATQAGNPGDSHCLYMKEAWLLIALRRPVEGIAMARRAQQVWQVNRKPREPYGGLIFWEPWIAEAAVALAEGNWSRAEECASQVLRDFDEEHVSYVLLELALHAQGRLHPERVWSVCKDPARALAEFDLRAYALRRARDL